MSINWQSLLADYWPTIVAILGAVLGWNNRKEIAAKLSGLSTPSASEASWPADKVAPSGTSAFVDEIVLRTKGMPPEKVLSILSDSAMTPDIASQDAVEYFRGEVKA